MPYNSFLNAKQLFGSAYAFSNPAPKLLKLIKAHPSYHTVSDLLDYYIYVVQKNPYRANELAFWMVCISESRDVPNIGYDSFGAAFDRALADRHCWGFERNKRTETFGPTNTYLINSLLSGLSLKHRLTNCSIGDYPRWP